LQGRDLQRNVPSHQHHGIVSDIERQLANRPVNEFVNQFTLDSISMAEEIRISPDGTHIRVTSVGPPSLSEMTQTLSKLVELRLVHRIDKVLVDSRARSGQPPALDIFRGGELLAKKLGAGTRIAVLVGQIEGDHTLFENVTVNRGAVVAFFQQEALALRWLLKNER
jgi:hypothetical protein